MYKEIIISLIIVIFVVGLNSVTQNYTKESLDTMKQDLSELREEITQENVDKEKIDSAIKIATDNWEARQNKLAYYLEHDELEKVETRLTELKSKIEMEEIEQAVAELDACSFVLEHIEDKESYKLKNIFYNICITNLQKAIDNF